MMRSKPVSFAAVNILATCNLSRLKQGHDFTNQSFEM